MDRKDDVAGVTQERATRTCEVHETVDQVIPEIMGQLVAADRPTLWWI